MIAGTNRVMMKLNIENPNVEPSFEDYVSSMMQNSLLEPSDEAPIFRNEYKQFGSFGLAGKGTDQKIVSTNGHTHSYIYILTSISINRFPWTHSSRKNWRRKIKSILCFTEYINPLYTVRSDLSVRIY